MEDNRVGDKKLLVARSDERYRKIYRWLWYVLENEELDRGTSREIEVEWDTRKVINILDGRLYNQVTISS